MRDEQISMTSIGALQALMASENELLRCAALQAYVRQQPDLGTRRACLVEALLDPDPDMRADAMEALADIAVADDAPAIRRSLVGDPVREVKQAAIRALGRIGTQADKALLRKLVVSRCDDTVAWEDELGDWEEWLDVQVCAIEALGQLGDTDGIENLFEAHDDPHGQNLSTPVFNALGEMGATGVTWLLAVVRTGDGLARTRAARTLARLAPEVLVDHVDTLLEHTDSALRLIAVNALAVDDARLKALATDDTDPAVRCAALSKGVAVHPDLAMLGLKDVDASVQATALDALRLPLDSNEAEAVADNICAWVSRAKPVLLKAAARNLPRFAPERAEALLTDLVHDVVQPLDARVIAVRTLADLQPPVPAEVFTALLSNPAQQVRLAAVVALRDGFESDEVRSVLAKAVGLSYLSENEATLERIAETEGPEVGAPKEGGTVQSHIRISPDGEIIDVEAVPLKGSSTLASILVDATASPEPLELAEDTPEESAPKRKKRRAVEGPDEVAKSLALDVLRSCATMPGAAMETAVFHCLAAKDDDLRAAAWKAVSLRVCADENARRVYTNVAFDALQDTDPVIRFNAFEVLDFGREDGAVQEKALAAADALTRAAAIACLPAKSVLEHLGDPAEIARQAAVNVLLKDPVSDVVRDAITKLMAVKCIDTLSLLLTGSDVARKNVLSNLASGTLNDQQIYICLRALAGAKT